VSDAHPAHGINDTVHQRHRLGMLVVLTEARKADFVYLKSTLGLTDGNLGRHIQVLEEAGMVKITKVFEERRPRTWIQITAAGRKALNAELDVLEGLIERTRGRPG
jgi:DNA-binding MarR family transcriptional regulator